MAADNIRILLRIVGEHRLQFGVDRALAAIHHDRSVVEFFALLEDDVVVLVEGVAADRVGTEIALDIMPVETGAADRHHGGAIFVLVLGIGGLFQQADLPGHAIVIIEEAVADEHFGLGEIGTERRHRRPGLRLRGGCANGDRQHGPKSPDHSRHFNSP